MSRYTDGRPEEEFLTRAHERMARRDVGDVEDEPTIEIIVDQDDLMDDGIAPPERDPRVPPGWRLRRHPIEQGRGMVLAVLLVFAITIVWIGAWALSTGVLPSYESMQPSPHQLPGAEDVGQPGSRNPF